MLRRKAFSLTELLVITAIIAILAAILFPVFRQAAQTARKSNVLNLKKLALAAQRYGQDADERIPIVSNGHYRDLLNVADGQLTMYGAQRTDLWPLLLMPYMKDRSLFVDPDRGDSFGIWAAAPLATTDPGYVPTKNTFRNQSRFPMFGFNYLFLSPMYIPASKMSDATPTDYMIGEVHDFFAAFDPSGTVFYTPSYRGSIPQAGDDTVGVKDTARGFWGVNAPGMWDVLIASFTPYVTFWTGTNCSGDWCGADIDPNTDGVQTSENFFYKPDSDTGNNTVFLDSHVKFMSATDLAAGTNYPTSGPTDGGSGYFGGGCHITDKSQYLWNLDSNYFGA